MQEQLKVGPDLDSLASEDFCLINMLIYSTINLFMSKINIIETTYIRGDMQDSTHTQIYTCT